MVRNSMPLIPCDGLKDLDSTWIIAGKLLNTLNRIIAGNLVQPIRMLRVGLKSPFWKIRQPIRTSLILLCKLQIPYKQEDLPPQVDLVFLVIKSSG